MKICRHILHATIMSMAIAMLIVLNEPSLGWAQESSAADTASSTSLTPQPLGSDSLFTLEQVLNTALLENADLRSMNSMWKASIERPAQESALPNPMFAYSGMNEVGGYQFPGTEEKRLELQQEFPWFGKRGLRSKIASKDAEATGYEYQTMSRDMIFMVKETYFDLYSVQRALSITRSQEGLLKQMESIALAKYQVGEVTQQDVLKAQSEIPMLQTRVFELEQQEGTLKAKLNQLMNRPSEAPLGMTITVPPKGFEIEGKDLFGLANENRPEIKRAQVEIDRYRSFRDLMRKEFWPDYRLGLEYRSIRSTNDMLMFTLGFDLPLWRGKYKAGEREATLMLESKQQGLEASQKQTFADVQSAYFKWQSAQHTFNLYQTALIGQAEARYRASEAGYRTGQVGFLDLLESERFLLDTRVMAAMAEGTVGISWARLERAVGMELNPEDVPRHQP